ncbi:NAD(P)/FAD-dependent oxidoreductase [Candidatus Bathyarchaeota archaeon]|nr:NAD(P)/FAD-dependent oxidoreductase [Candidatus Bathyarchaeota archaeon]
MKINSSVYDTVVIGGGPAGIAAAMHLGFHQRRVLVIDRKTSPMQFANTPIHNYPGVKPLVAPTEILQKMRKELREYDVETLFGNVIRITGQAPNFHVAIKSAQEALTTVTAKTLVLATGIARKHPKVDGDWKKWLPFAGKNRMSYYCPDCDSPQAAGKDVIIVNAGTANSALHVARCIKPFATRIRIFMTEDAYAPYTKNSETILNKSEFEWTHGLVKKINILEPGKRQQLITADGQTLECNIFFVAWIAVPRNELAIELGVELDGHGNIITDFKGATNIKGVWAAGDVRPITQTVATAVGTGVYTGIMIAHYLISLA